MELIVQHFNHCKRGAESDADADFVKKASERLNCDFVLEHAGTREWGADNFHLEAREWRRSSGRRLAASKTNKQAAALVCTAHHALDHAESVLQHILRGSGVQGLIGLKEFDFENPNEPWRPFASTSSHDLLDYISTQQVAYRDDASNFEDVYQRNFIRNRIVPLLREINPSFETAFLRLSDNADEVCASLERYEKKEDSAEILLSELTSEGALLRRAWRKHPDLKSVLTLNSAKNILHEARTVRAAGSKVLLGGQQKLTDEKKIPLRENWVAKLTMSTLVFCKEQVEDGKDIPQNVD